MMARPNLDDLDELKAYRKELRQVGRPLSLAGLAIILVGLLLLGANRYDWLPVHLDPLIVFGLLVGGWGLMIWAFFKRNIHHRNRMAEPAE
jgi:hypothetical protein